MANEALYQELAKALSQPSRTYRAAQAGLDIPTQALQGYLGGSDIADKLQQRKYGKMTLADLLGDPSKVENLPISTLKTVEPALDYYAKTQKSLEDSLTPSQALSFGVDQPFIDTFGGKPISRQVAQGYTANKSRDKIATALQGRTQLQVANAINHNVNSLTSSGALGVAGKNNLRIARVKSLLERPSDLTPQELELVTTDLAGVIQGGAPLQNTIEGQAIGTLSTRLAELMKNVSNSPQTFNDRGFRSRIIMLANEMIKADNQVQDKAFGNVVANFGHLTTPEHLSRVRQAIKNNEQLPIIDVGESGGSLEGAAIGEATKASDDELRRIAGQ